MVDQKIHFPIGTLIWTTSFFCDYITIMTYVLSIEGPLPYTGIMEEYIAWNAK